MFPISFFQEVDTRILCGGDLQDKGCCVVVEMVGLLTFMKHKGRCANRIGMSWGVMMVMIIMVMIMIMMMKVVVMVIVLKMMIMMMLRWC